MKKSLLKGLFLLSCLFFFSSVDINAQTFRSVEDIKTDFLTEKVNLQSQYDAVDKTDLPAVILIKKKIKSVNFISENLGYQDVLEKLFIEALVKHSGGTFTGNDYMAGDFSSPEVSALHSYLKDLLTE